MKEFVVFTILLFGVSLFSQETKYRVTVKKGEQIYAKDIRVTDDRFDVLELDGKIRLFKLKEIIEVFDTKENRTVYRIKEINELDISKSDVDIAEYGKPLKNGFYKSYVSKDGTVVRIGDTVHINIPNGTHYNYISQGGGFAGSVLANKKVVISKIKVYGTAGHEPILFTGFKGYGLLTVFISYELALEVGEIYNPNGMITPHEAIEILKEKKELLDLEIISKEEYDEIKNELTPIITGKE